MFEYNPSFEIWNSGILGINQCYAIAFDDVLLLTDALYNQFPKHVCEKVACSYYLQKITSINAAEDNFVHYWIVKEFRKLLLSFFKKYEEESIPNKVKGAHQIAVSIIQKHKQQFWQLNYHFIINGFILQWDIKR